MKKTKSLITVLLCLIMVFTSVSFVSCGGNEDETTVATTVDPNENAGYFVPEEKYDREITILCPMDDAEWSCGDFFEESMSDEPIPDAVYRRKTLIEEKFGVTIKMVEGAKREDINTKVRTDNTSGDKTYDIVMQTVPRCYVLAQNNDIINLESVDNLDLTSDAWDQSILSQTSNGGQNYFATGDITTMDNDATWVMMFNKQVAENKGFGTGGADIYELVKSGDWTMDKLLEITADLYEDKDNDGALSSGDIYGIATTVDFIQGLFYGADARIITKDPDTDLPTLDFNTQHNNDIIDKIISIYYASNEIVYDCHNYIAENPQVHLLAQAMFEENRALFYSEVMQCAIRLRDMDTDYGIIPVPKYNKEQANYTTHTVADVTLACCFPKNLEADSTRLAISGAIAQALAVEGQNILTPAYYEKSLMQKGARDAESQEMLPIIFANRVADIGYMADDGKITVLYNSMREMIKKGQNTMASSYKGSERRVNAGLEALIEAYESL